MNTGLNVIEISVVRWDDGIISRVCSRLNGRSGRAVRGKAVSLLTGAYASALFCGGSPPERLISHHANGKPYMEGFPDITVSISHCSDTAAVSLSPIVHGIDIERPRPVRDGIRRYVFHADEEKLFRSLPPDEQTGLFFRMWTRKEALIKTGAITLGGMSGVCVISDEAEIDGAVYYFSTQTVGSLILSLCCRGERAAIAVTEPDPVHQETALKALERLYFGSGDTV